MIVARSPSDDASGRVESGEVVRYERVSLSAEKLAGMQLETVVVQRTLWQPTRVIMGRMDYDQERHIAVSSAVDGVITQMIARPGASVKRGELLAIVTSPEVGLARSEILKNRAAAEIAKERFLRHEAICTGVEKLVRMIREADSPANIERELQQQSLGVYRDSLMTAYTRSRLAGQMVTNLGPATSSGAVAGRIQQQRESENQAAEAALTAALEESLFQTRQDCQQSRAALEDVRRQLEIAQQHLKTLLGPAAPAADAEEFDGMDANALSQVRVVSPIDGTIEERLLSAAERVTMGDTLMVVADANQLWAVADVRERDWSALAVHVGDSVKVAAAAIPDTEYVGKVLIVSRRMDPASGAAPLVAEVQTDDPRLRPGLFMRMTVPTGPARETVIVPESAIVVHEGQSFVFVAAGERDFRRVDVKVQKAADDRFEVLEGLNEGDTIVSHGAFLLKSELLLAGEEE
jgi:RND family efflux transporter MFP subunit